MEYIIESSLDSYFSMGIEEWLFNFQELLEMTKIFFICEGKKQGY
jgi:hypothetical protein